MRFTLFNWIVLLSRKFSLFLTLNRASALRIRSSEHFHHMDTKLWPILQIMSTGQRWVKTLFFSSSTVKLQGFLAPCRLLSLDSSIMSAMPDSLSARSKKTKHTFSRLKRKRNEKKQLSKEILSRYNCASDERNN